MESPITFTSKTPPTTREKENIIDFLYLHLDQFGDPIEDIKKAVDYALKKVNSFGGFIIQLKDEGKVIGAVVVNRTGMKGYIPENILVYIAIDKNYRGKGLGKKLMQTALEKAEGDIALHVEPDNPARVLYEKLGFTNKYFEMRYQKQ
ncbi:MAG: GNAT family N-acetyltransferase [Prolixibacteraceae bacterium]|jgi:ribosomal-protein-alanine N-acetyltransferase|nr:GNAT family N-acetyltransferase [Prolixibacteraceae bacterium]